VHKPRLRVRCLLAGIVASATLALGAWPAVAQSEVPTSRELYRPQLHFTPGEHWMNDPNGLVHYEGESYLFYQWNSLGAGWGSISWGTALAAISSTDEAGTCQLIAVYFGCKS